MGREDPMLQRGREQSLQTSKHLSGFLAGSLSFHLGCHLSFHLGFHARFYLGFHFGFYLRFHSGFLGVSFRVSVCFLFLRFHLGFRLGFLYGQGFFAVSFGFFFYRFIRSLIKMSYQEF